MTLKSSLRNKIELLLIDLALDVALDHIRNYWI